MSSDDGCLIAIAILVSPPLAVAARFGCVKEAWLAWLGSLLYFPGVIYAIYLIKHPEKVQAASYRENHTSEELRNFPAQGEMPAAKPRKSPTASTDEIPSVSPPEYSAKSDTATTLGHQPVGDIPYSKNV